MFLPIFFHYEWDEMFIETEASKHIHGYIAVIKTGDDHL